MPRILVFTAYYHPFIGGVETHARSIANYLREMDYGVVVLTKRPDKDSPSPTLVDEVPVYHIPPSGPRSSTRKWLMILSAFWFLLRHSKVFDLIYCPGYQGIGVAAVAAGKILGKPVVLNSGNLGVMSCRNWDLLLEKANIATDGRLVRIFKAIVRHIYASADAVICIAREIEEEAVESGVPPERIHYLPNTVDTRCFRPADEEERRKLRGQEGWKDDRIICLYVGRLSAEKGIMDLIEAWRMLGKTRGGLIVVGPEMPGHSMDVGPLVRKAIKDNGMADSVTLYGPCEEIWRLLRGADIFVQPSHYEAFGISVIEAMATGLPVVATSVGGMLDYLVHDENALLCEPHTPDDLADKISRLMKDPELRERLGEAGRLTVEHRFSEEVVFQRYTSLLSSLSEKNGRNDR